MRLIFITTLGIIISSPFLVPSLIEALSYSYVKPEGFDEFVVDFAGFIMPNSNFGIGKLLNYNFAFLEIPRSYGYLVIIAMVVSAFAF